MYYQMTEIYISAQIKIQKNFHNGQKKEGAKKSSEESFQKI
jgi:hypothetical protein